MNTIKITGIVSRLSNQKEIGLITEPPITEEVLNEAKKYVGSESTLHIKLVEGILVVYGTVWPPRAALFENVSKLLSDANDDVVKRNELAEANHKSIVDQYAKAAGLPVIE